MGLFIDDLRRSVPYNIIILRDRYGEVRRIGGILSKPVDFRFSANYQSISQSINSSAPMSGIVQSLASTSLVSPFTSYQVWMGSEPLEITVNITLLAVKLAIAEVVNQMLEFLTYPLPRSGKGAFGGAVFDPPVLPNEKGFAIATSYFSIPNLIVTGVNVSPAHAYGTAGYPVRADVEITFRSRLEITDAEFKSYFQTKASSSIEQISDAANEALSSTPTVPDLNTLMDGATKLLSNVVSSVGNTLGFGGD